MSETAAVASFVESTTYDDVPRDVLDHARRHVRDTLGVALAGSVIDIGTTAREYAFEMNPGDDATVIGGGTASAAGAAFANGVLAHAMEWDDTPGAPHHLSHPSAPTLPAVLAAAERADATGRDALAGYVVGCEVLSRLERASFPEHYFHGWHDTATYGVFGAVAGAASVLDLDGETIRRALGIAASCSAGLRKNNGTMTKPFHAGHAAEDGLRAAILADAGFTADDAILEGHIGYGAVYSPGGYDPAPVGTLGEEWDLLDYGYKPFPAITHNHGAQVALLRIVEREDLDPRDVERVVVTLDEAASDILWVREPEDPFEGICSIEFNLATILRERGHGIAEFTEGYVTAPETRAQMAKVERDFGFEDGDHDQFTARVVVETVDGDRYVETEHYSPLGWDDEFLRAKFYDCATTAIDRDAAERADDAIEHVEDAGRLDELLGTLGGR